MEHNPQNNLLELQLSEEGKTNINGIGQYALVNAVVGFVSLGISVIAMFITVAKVSAVNSGAAAGSVVTVCISAVISLLLNITLLKAATNLKKSIAFSDQGYFAAGFSKLASYFRIVGILVIIFLIFFMLAMLVVVIAGANGGFDS